MKKQWAQLTFDLRECLLPTSCCCFFVQLTFGGLDFLKCHVSTANHYLLKERGDVAKRLCTQKLMKTMDIFFLGKIYIYILYIYTFLFRKL